ncbi:MAG: octaprenyl diphosphate synthase [Thermoplasmata archaeon]|nr:MAG: octaprenyl diphosphate synthase [Deltaproteobacteria bacterium]RLF61362.1 MAG: octaprenyl diphosphate synthase [Thermoplasmata archaeon]
MDSEKKILAKYQSYFEKIDQEVEKALTSRVSLIEEIGGHTLLGGGKRLRPLFFILSCELCGFHDEILYRLSTIFEYIHTASLLHDDVLDNANIRRKKPSANHLWGNHAAVLEGDFLYSKSFCVAVEAGNVSFLKLITNTTTQMAEGQILELLHTNDWNMNRDMYLDIINAKTAVLISAACAAGGILSSADPKEIEALQKFGHLVGMAFQIMDDLLDYTSDQAVFGKPVGKDIREGKITLPLIYALEGMSDEEKKLIQELFEQREPSNEEYQDLIDLVRRNGVLQKVQSDAQKYVDEAALCLDGFPDSPARENFLELNRFIIERHY